MNLRMNVFLRGSLGVRAVIRLQPCLQGCVGIVKVYAQAEMASFGRRKKVFKRGEPNPRLHGSKIGNLRLGLRLSSSTLLEIRELTFPKPPLHSSSNAASLPTNCCPPITIICSFSMFRPVSLSEWQRLLNFDILCRKIS